MKIVRWNEAGFEAAVAALENRGEAAPPGVAEAVEKIVRDVRERGDEALAEYTLRFDKVDLARTGAEIGREALLDALESLPPADREILEEAAVSIRDFHSRQVEKTWTYEAGEGILLGQKITPLARVGLYVPGGTAAYPSSVLMNAIPARVAGVGQVVMAVPTPGGLENPAVLAAAAIAGVDRVFRVGGAQAVAAMAYGTATVPRVDKIVGPGNIYVATAKRSVFGQVDIDMVAGPSEILVLSDRGGDPAFAAADLLSQAEHDPLAYPILVTDDERFLLTVEAQIRSQAAILPRREIAERSLADRGLLILARDMAQAVEVVNRVAPEHLELMVDAPEAVLEGITCAGAVFLGRYTAEALGDYMAGPNHVLPTGGTARFFSPLGVYDFVKRTSVIGYSKEALGRRAEKVARFARLEGLEAHARAVDMRVGKK